MDIFSPYYWDGKRISRNDRGVKLNRCEDYRFFSPATLSLASSTSTILGSAFFSTKGSQGFSVFGFWKALTW
jgi:hypothetical protein